MNFTMTAEQETLNAEAARFAREQLAGPCSGDGEAPTHGTLWRACVAQRFTGLPLPVAFGGRGLGLLDSILAFEAMAAAGADPGFIFSLGVHQFAAAAPLASIGTAQQKEDLLRAMAEGGLCGAIAISEAEAGSDSYALKATATETADGYLLNGEKIWITNAPVADVILVCARSENLPGAFGISCFIVRRGTQGLSVVEGPKKAGITGAPWGIVRLENVSVPADSLLGGRGGGAAVFREAMRWERCGLYAIVTGAMARSLDACLLHVKDRYQFGRPLIDNAAVARALALMRTRLDAARLLLYRAAWLFDTGTPDDVAISLAKAYVSEAAIDNGLQAQQLYGAMGTLADSPAARFLNDMLPFRTLSGPTEVHYQIAARLMQRTGA